MLLHIHPLFIIPSSSTGELNGAADSAYKSKKVLDFRNYGDVSVEDTTHFCFSFRISGMAASTCLITVLRAEAQLAMLA